MDDERDSVALKMKPTKIIFKNLKSVVWLASNWGCIISQMTIDFRQVYYVTPQI